MLDRSTTWWGVLGSNVGPIDGVEVHGPLQCWTDQRGGRAWSTPILDQPAGCGGVVDSNIGPNGGTAGRLYKRYLQERTGLPAIVLPSTSPANAAWRLERLVERWSEAVDWQAFSI